MASASTTTHGNRTQFGAPANVSASVGPIAEPNRDEAARACPKRNVGGLERAITGLAGGALLGAGLSSRPLPLKLALSLMGGGLVTRAMTGYCPGYDMLGIDTAHADNEAVGVRAQHGFRYQRSRSIARPLEEVFAFWRHLENLPRLFDHLEQVVQTDSIHSNWRATGPLEKQYEWEAE